MIKGGIWGMSEKEEELSARSGDKWQMVLKKKTCWDRGKVLSFNFNFYFEVIKEQHCFKAKGLSHLHVKVCKVKPVC